MHSKTIEMDVQSIDKKWCEDDFYRIFYNILNAGIPPFERYVIKTMREVRDDPRLANESRLRELVDIFVQQEIEHTKAHVPVNKQLELDQFPISKRTEKMTRFIQRKTPLYMSVASSAFIEFVGFGFFESHIEKDVLYTSGMHEEMAKLWKWHTAEELEHSFVKLKVINHLSNSYWLKFLGMIEALVVANLYVTTLIPAVVRQDAKANGKKFWPHLWMFMKGLAKTDWGVNRQSLSQYFSKNFDPEIKEPWVADVIDKWIEETGAQAK